MISKICELCGKRYEIYPSQIINPNGNKRRYCSLECSWKDYSKCHKPYIRTPQLNKKMSELHKINPRVRENINKAITIAADNKRGKKYEEIYGVEKSISIKTKISNMVNGILNPNYGNGKKISGTKNPNWRGGKSFEPYTPEFNNIVKEIIRMRYLYACAECGKTELELNRKLDIHHIDYNKKNNQPNNLIPLCKRCHSKTNFNRQDWTKYYKQKCI